MRSSGELVAMVVLSRGLMMVGLLQGSATPPVVDRYSYLDMQQSLELGYDHDHKPHFW